MSRRITERQLNRTLLARQLLLARSDKSIPQALEQIGGIQNQYAPNAYIRLLSCLENFNRDDLTHALEQRTVVQGTLMRGTIHLVSSKDYWLFARGIRRSLAEWSLRLQENSSVHDMKRDAARIQRALRDSSPLSATELKKLVPGFIDEGSDLVRVPPSGTWLRRRANLYALAEDWIGASAVTETEGLEHLVKRYLGGFGPARLAETSSWCGVPAATLIPVIERMAIRRFQSENGDELLDVPDAPLPSGDEPAPPRLLPKWDAMLLVVHARRTGILPEAYRGIVFHNKNPQSIQVFLIDGRVAGSWKEKNGRIVLEPFNPVSRSARNSLQEEAERVRVLYRS